MVRISGLSRLLSSALLVTAPLAGPTAAQVPQAGQVRSGSASIDSGVAETVIRQSSHRAVLDWRGFDVGRDHAVRFEQPNAESATLNRITGGAPSRIEGRITAPGTVIFQNESGVLFTDSSRIDVGGLVATSGRANAEAFQRGDRLRIEGGGNSGARVVNEGNITIGEAGLAALVGRNVENTGTIEVRHGTVALASGTEATLDLSGDGMLHVTGAEPGAQVDHSGSIEVGEGRVLMTAGAVSGALDGAINVSGVVRAGGSSEIGGVISLAGGGGAVRINGTLDASGSRKGGRVDVSGTTIKLSPTARIAASGGAGGGTVKIGGDVGGVGPMPRAKGLAVLAGAEVAAEGGAGQGGQVVLWSDGDTIFDGKIRTGGETAGGFVETSGRERLAVGAGADVEVGKNGEWLLDPRDVVIAAGGATNLGAGVTVPPAAAGTFEIKNSALSTVLNSGGNVTVSTFQPGSTAQGTITVKSPINWSGAGNLTFLAEADIRIDAAVRSTGLGSFTLDANRDLFLNAPIEATGAGNLTLIARVGDISFAGSKFANTVLATGSGSLNIEARKGSILMRRDKAGDIQVGSQSGSTSLKAGREILLEGGAAANRGVRLGDMNSTAPVTLNAPWITVHGGTAPGSFAEIASKGGTIEMRAIDIAVQNGEGRATVQAGANLTMRAEQQVWDGLIRVGTDADGGGDVQLSGKIAAGVQPIFDLAPDHNFRLAERTPRGARSGYTSGQPFTVRTREAGVVRIEAPVTSEQITLMSQEAVELAATGRLAATAPTGDTIVVAAGRRFTNNGDADVFSLADPDARWLLYVNGFGDIEGPVPADHGFDLYGRTYPALLPVPAQYGGNRIIYAERPILTITADSLSKTYGETVTPEYALSGLRKGDILDNALTAIPAVTSEGAPANAKPGRYSTTIAAEASAQGYLLQTENGVIDIARRPLRVIAENATGEVGAPLPAFTARYEGFVLGENEGNLEGTLSFATNATEASPPDTYNITPGGVRSETYDISFEPGQFSLLPVVPVLPGTPLALAIADRFTPVRRGIEPFTPGDASFRTTITEAPPALSAPFSLTYSLGQVASLATEQPAPTAAGFIPAAGGADAASAALATSAPDTTGFVPAAGGLAEEAEGGSGCRGAVRVPDQEVCVLVPREESFWVTREEGLQ